MKAFIKGISVKRTGIGDVPSQFGLQTHCFPGTPECKLNSAFFGLKSVGFSCMGGIL